MRAFVVVVLLAGCGRLPAVETRWPGGPSEALEILNRRQCSKCHSVETVFGARGMASERDVAVAERKLPTLSSMERFRADWLRAFLAAPYVVRPNLVERMVPQGLTPREIETLVTSWRAAESSAPLSPSEAEAGPSLARGAALYDAKQCGACHVFGSRGVTGGDADLRLRALAPNLAHTRNRLPRTTIEALIRDPASVKPTTQMPRVELSDDDAHALADFIWAAEVSPATAGR